jgi:hypothetical protein
METFNSSLVTADGLSGCFAVDLVIARDVEFAGKKGPSFSVGRIEVPKSTSRLATAGGIDGIGWAEQTTPFP